MTHLFISSNFLSRIVLCVLLGAGSSLALALPQGGEVAAATQIQSVNINKADSSTLAAVLNGIGESRAREIVRHREKYGPFTSVEELIEVKGVGATIVEKNRDRIVVE